MCINIIDSSNNPCVLLSLYKFLRMFGMELIIFLIMHWELYVEHIFDDKNLFKMYN